MPPPTTTSDKAGHIWMVTGCAGCGKTTVASHLAETLGLPFLEGDDVSTSISSGSSGHTDTQTVPSKSQHRQDDEWTTSQRC